MAIIFINPLAKARSRSRLAATARYMPLGKKKKPLIYSLFLFFTLPFAGCSPVDLGIFENGNPQVRQLQKSQVDLLVDEEKKVFLEKYVGDRVELIWLKREMSLSPSRDNLRTAGRAAAVSSDGYFLTAYHVVDDGPFYLHDTIQTARHKKELKAAAEKNEPLIISKEERELYFREEIKRGRIVWFNHQADLALIKFDKVTSEYFEFFSKELNLSEIVIATDNSGNGWVPLDGSIGQVEGNWKYFAAGKVVEMEKLSSDLSQVTSTMVARRGMSGGAVTDLNGYLCGVLLRVEGPNLDRLSTISSLMTQAKLIALIKKDQQTESGQTSQSRQSDTR